ncbi:hypothetical protein CCACVL1_07394 [Corchorus capsularis]|uniref:Uncharacterized protein n=1 Tax=Corchorus capsularis TaxID=210143 RepID=A0A1R3J695_COCAP|nr:hypothetical protein CCACVL1_07394 [Corchorus capsularis]
MALLKQLGPTATSTPNMAAT